MDYVNLKKDTYCWVDYDTGAHSFILFISGDDCIRWMTHCFLLNRFFLTHHQEMDHLSDTDNVSPLIKTCCTTPLHYIALYSPYQMFAAILLSAENERQDEALWQRRDSSKHLTWWVKRGVPEESFAMCFIFYGLALKLTLACILLCVQVLKLENELCCYHDNRLS